MSFLRQPKPQSIDDIRDWYEGVVESLVHHRAAVHNALRIGGMTEPRFVGMAAGDIDAFFVAQRNNLDQLAIMNLVASAEASLLMDFKRRVEGNFKDRLSKAYAMHHRTLPLGQKVRPPLDHGILEQLKAAGVVPAHFVSRFRDVLRLRHWIAHGRYWAQPLANRAYLPDEAYHTIATLLAALPP